MKILIIGLGSVAKKHVKVLKKINSEFQFFALRSSLKSTDVSDIISIYSWESVNFNPYFIIISNPTSEHFKTIEKSLKYKCPLFIEKPSISNLNNSIELLNKIILNNIITYIGCDLRFNPALIHFKEQIRKLKRINEVNIYCGSNLKTWRKGVNYKDSYSANATLGGGVHLDLYHEFDYCYWFFGKPNKISKILSNKSSLDINSFDYANYILEYNSFNISIILNYYRTDVKRVIEIVSEDKTIKLNLIEGKINDSSKNSTTTLPASSEDIYFEQMKYFLNCIELKKDTFNNFNFSLEVLNLIF